MRQLWLHWFAVATAVATLALIGVGGVVTSRGVGMAVPDWPNSFGYNMFLFPVSKWVGGVFYEHTHRLVASVVGLLVVALTRALGGRKARLLLVLLGLAEIAGGLRLLRVGAGSQGAGHFLVGIGVVVLLAGVCPWPRETSPRPLPLLGWVALATVQVQGLLGGLRVVLFKDELGVFHATLAQLFLVLLCAIALLTSRWWPHATAAASPKAGLAGLRRALLVPTALILGQLVLGAVMRHQHAGLAIPDFPLAYGKLWPATDPDAIARYNARRMEVTSVNPITAAQVLLQMAHRLMAGLILVAVAAAAWRARRLTDPGSILRRGTLAWMALIVAQLSLGAATVWSDKAADVATAHVLLGAVSLAFGAILVILTFREPKFARGLSVS